MDYEKEVKTLKAYEPKEYFKPSAGRYEVLFLGEPMPASFNDGDKVTDQIEFQVSVKQKVLSWTMARGLSFKSLFGQLMALGNVKGHLKEEKITLLVTGEDKNKTYVVLEALSLIENKDQSNSNT